MSSLLSPFNFGQKHAYFHAKITIHELTNVPLVTGNFKTRWRVKNHHNLQSIPLSQGDNQNDRDALAGSEDGLGGERRSLHHKKSFASSIASQDNSTSEGVKRLSTSSSKGDYKTSLKGDDSRERKTSNRFLSGFKDAFQNKGRKPSSSQESTKQSLTAEKDEPGKEYIEKQDGGNFYNHSKHESHDSSRFEKPKRQASFSDSVKISSLSSKTFEEKEVSHQHSSSHPFSFLHLESRGETTNEKVKDHTVKWERTVDVGLRIPIEKQRLNEKGHSGTPAATASGALTPSGPGQGPPSSSDGHSSAQGNRGDHKSIPSSKSMGDLKNENGEGKGEKEVKEKEKDRELANAWGMLGNAEMKITIKAEIATETNGHHHSSDPHMTMGYILINLAEFAPYPESSAHHHHHLLHHHHAYSHHQHHHHHHSHHSTTLSRTETRRYLLTNSRNNATLKMTIEMTHVGGTKEYAVPAIRRGLIVAGVSSLIDAASHAGGSGPSSEADHSAEGHERARSGGHDRNDGRYSFSQNPSLSSISNEPMSAWPTNSVARHVRIPSSNLRTEVSHQDAARAVKEAGGQRMGFSFGAGAHHERPPEDVIDALFSTSSTNGLVNMLTPYRGENAKQKSLPTQRQKKGESEIEDKPREKKSDDKIERGILPEKPPHFDGVIPAEHPKDSAQSTGSPLSRFSFDTGMTSLRPGIDMPLVQPLIDQRRESKSSEEHGDERDSKHRRNSSGNTMRSILANSTSSSKASRPLSNPAGPPSSSSVGGMSSQDSSLAANQGKQSNSSGQSQKTNLVHWDASVSHESHEQDSSSPSPFSANLTIPTARLTTSPSIMSYNTSDDKLSPIEPIKKSSSIGSRKSPFFNRDVEEEDEEEEEGEEGEEEQRTRTRALTPPTTPPDAELRDFHIALDNGENHKIGKGSFSATRSVKGLTKEEALQKGYRGAGWGTMEMLRPLQRLPDLESAPYNFSSGIYSGSTSSSQSRETVSS